MNNKNEGIDNVMIKSGLVLGAYPYQLSTKDVLNTLLYNL